MSADLIHYYEKALRDKAPYQFKNVSWELPDGWINLIGILSGLIDERLEQGGFREDARKETIFGGFSQLKEKFGGARFYCHYILCEENEALVTDIRTLISQAEELSIKLCIECGEFGELKCVGGWWATLCEEHYQAENNSGS